MAIEDVNNSDAILRAIDLALAKGADQIGAWLEGRIVEAIDQQHSNGLGWPPLAPATVRRKRRKARRVMEGGEKAWVDTGELREKITHMTRQTGSRQYTAFVGIFDEWNAQKAMWLEFGTQGSGAVVAGGIMHQWSRSHIPERPLFRGVTDRDEKRIYENLNAFMASAFAQALQETLRPPKSGV